MDKTVIVWDVSTGSALRKYRWAKANLNFTCSHYTLPNYLSQIHGRQGSRRDGELRSIQRGFVDRHERLDRLHRQVLGRQDEAPGARADVRGDKSLLPTSILRREESVEFLFPAG